jgi:raffinose/stachyose/melibiose transport system permease protein
MVFIAAFLAPALVLYGVFILYAIANSIRFSLYNWTGLGDLGAFVGLANYEFVLWSGSLSSQFWVALGHNFYFFAITLALISVGGLAVAFALTLVRESKAQIYKTIFFIPMVIPPIVVAYLWGMYLDPNSGALSVILRSLHLTMINLPYLGLQATALPTIAVITVWSSLGLYIFIFIPAINNVPAEIIEAAKVDGAGAVRTFFSIVFPNILPTYITVTALVFVAAFGAFDLIYILEGPGAGPDFSTDTIATLFFRSAFGSTQGGASTGMSLAAAMAILGFIVVIGVSAILIALQRRAARQAGEVR